MIAPTHRTIWFSGLVVNKCLRRQGRLGAVPGFGQGRPRRLVAVAACRNDILQGSRGKAPGMTALRLRQNDADKVNSLIRMQLPRASLIRVGSACREPESPALLLAFA